MAGYNGAFAGVYDYLMRDIDYSAKADYLIKEISAIKDRCELVLDLACGTGSLSVEFAKRGKEVIGVDLSEDMLMQAAEKNDGLEKPVLYLCQDICELDLYGTVDAAVCIFDSLNHIEGKENLQRVFDRLKFFVEPGGVFIFDMNTPFKHKYILGNETFVFDTEKVYCVWQNAYDEKEKCVDISLDFFEPQGKDGLYCRSEEYFTEYSYETDEIAEMLRKAGFTLVGVRGDYTGKQPTENEERIIYIAKRN